MKNIVVFGKVIMLSLLFILGSCSSSDDNDNSGSDGSDGSGGTGGNVNTQINELKTIMTSGSWVVSFYFDTDHEETNNFTTFAFVFNGVETNNGTWSVTPDSSLDGVIDFTIFFADPPDFAELSDDWDVLSYTNDEIQLRDGPDLLTFERV